VTPARSYTKVVCPDRVVDTFSSPPRICRDDIVGYTDGNRQVDRMSMSIFLERFFTVTFESNG